jgi:hypothetical protein
MSPDEPIYFKKITLFSEKCSKIIRKVKEIKE